MSAEYIIFGILAIAVIGTTIIISMDFIKDHILTKD